MIVAFLALEPSVARAPLLAQDSAGLPLQSRRAAASVSYEQVRFPAGEAMGLVTTRFLVSHLGSWSVGPAVIGAVSGSRGGLFVLGAELGWAHEVTERLAVVAGVLAGGGGGGSAPVGSGFLWRPSAGVRWRAGAVALDLALSHVEIGHALLVSTQLALGLSVPTTFRFVPANDLSRPARSGAHSGMGFDVIAPFVTIYRPAGADGLIDRSALPTTIGLVGVRAERALGPHAGFTIEGAGAAAGGVAGYAEYLAHAWWRIPLVGSRVTLGTSAGAGMGGGGSVDVGGGLLLKGALTASIALGDEGALHVEGGVVTAPEGRFRAATATAALAWRLDGGAESGASELATRTEWWMGAEQYAAARVYGTNGALVNVVLRVNRFLTRTVYLSGQARSALKGGVGGFSAGLIGIGAATEPFAGWHVGAEATLGAAGGGGVSTAGGALAQGSAFVARDLVGGTMLRAGAGYVRSLRGALAAPVAEVALGYAFGVTRSTR